MTIKVVNIEGEIVEKITNVSCVMIDGYKEMLVIEHEGMFGVSTMDISTLCVILEP